MSCLGSLSNIVPSCCNPSDNGPNEWDVENGSGAERGPCKVMKVALGVLSLIAAAISGITMIATGNPLSLISTVTFGFAACYLLHSLGENTAQHRSTQAFRNNIHRITPPIVPHITPVMIPAHRHHVPRNSVPPAPPRYQPPQQNNPHTSVDNERRIGVGDGNREPSVPPVPPRHHLPQQNIPNILVDNERRIGVGDGNREPSVPPAPPRHQPPQQNIPNIPVDNERRIGVGDKNREAFTALPTRPLPRAWTNIPLRITPQGDQNQRVQAGQGDRVSAAITSQVPPQHFFRPRVLQRPQGLAPIQIPQQNNSDVRVQVGQGERVNTPVALPIASQNLVPNQIGNRHGNQPQSEERRIPIGQGGSVVPQNDNGEERIPIKRNK